MMLLRLSARAARLARRHPDARRTIVSSVGFRLAKKMMPKISETERIALGCGTVGFDRDIFGGSPALQPLLDRYEPRISAEERAFLDNQCEVVCGMLNDFDVLEKKDLPASVVRVRARVLAPP